MRIMISQLHSCLVQLARALKDGALPVFFVVFCFTTSELKAASAEITSHGETVMLDAWFNSQERLNADGRREYFHYKWSDKTDSGFSIFGNILRSHGAALDTLYQAPTTDRLNSAQIYIIVSPDNAARNPHPHYVQPQDADQIAAWVKHGGVLLLMGNDPANADIVHLNLISDRFGIHFDEVLKHHVIGDQFSPGYIPTSGGGPIFRRPYTLYMKDTCGISLKLPAEPLLEDKGGIVIASAKYGKGSVFAVVDPWLYNEYTDPHKVLPRQDNYEAGKEFVNWLLKQIPDNDRAASLPQMINGTTTGRTQNSR